MGHFRVSKSLTLTLTSLAKNKTLLVEIDDAEYLSEATTQSNLKIALSVKNSTSCKHWACCLRKMTEHWEEGKKGDFLPLPISLPFLRLPRRLSLQLQAHLSEFRGNFLRKSRYPARKSHFSSLDSDSTAKMSVPSSQKWTCSQVRKLCTYGRPSFQSWQEIITFTDKETKRV